MVNSVNTASGRPTGQVMKFTLMHKRSLDGTISQARILPADAFRPDLVGRYFPPDPELSRGTPLPYLKLTEIPQIPEHHALQALAEEIRWHSMNALGKAGCGHPGGTLSMAEMLAVLYGKHLRFDHTQPRHPLRDRMVLSKGHGGPGVYSALSLADFFPIEDLELLRQITSHLQGHPDMLSTRGIDLSTGRLGLGFAASLGMAVAAKMDGLDYLVHTIIGGGEAQEGIVAEAAELAPKLRLNNLIVFMDNNGLTINGQDSAVTLVDHALNWLAKGWQVMEIDGHNPSQIDFAIEAAKTTGGERPTLVLANTIKGTGVSFMTNNPDYHGKVPKGEQLAQALSELNARRNTALAEPIIAQMRSRTLSPAPAKAQRPPLNIDSAQWQGKKQATRETFGEWLIQAMEQCPDIVPIDADLAKSVMTDGANKRFGVFNLDPQGRSLWAGIREQLMVGLGAGLATCGKIPAMATFGTFTEIPFDIARQAFVKMKLPGIIIGTHGGVQVGEDGPSHMDLTSLRTFQSILPGRVFEPGDPYSTAAILSNITNGLIQALNAGQPAEPSYLRLTRSPVPDFSSVDLDVDKGYRIIILESLPSQISINMIASGAMLEIAQRAAKIINDDTGFRGRVTRLIDAFSVSNRGLASIKDAIDPEADLIVTLIDAIPETLGDPVRRSIYNIPWWQHSVPIFMELGPGLHEVRSGKPADVYEYLGLSPEKIAQRIRDTLALKIAQLHKSPPSL